VGRLACQRHARLVRLARHRVSPPRLSRLRARRELTRDAYVSGWVSRREPRPLMRCRRPSVAAAAVSHGHPWPPPPLFGSPRLSLRSWLRVGGVPAGLLRPCGVVARVPLAAAFRPAGLRASMPAAVCPLRSRPSHPALVVAGLVPAICLPQPPLPRRRGSAAACARRASMPGRAGIHARTRTTRGPPARPHSRLHALQQTFDLFPGVTGRTSLLERLCVRPVRISQASMRSLGKNVSTARGPPTTEA
jgi:hypothetical protein